MCVSHPDEYTCSGEMLTLSGAWCFGGCVRQHGGQNKRHPPGFWVPGVSRDCGCDSYIMFYSKDEKILQVPNQIPVC